ncbi:MAG: hypothetical protein ABIV51_10000 [Saprospiraceae bacterium]
MKRNTGFFSFAAFCVLLLSSCSPALSPFTESTYQAFTVDDLKKVQFYLSTDVILQRAASEGSAQISGGKIRMVNGRRVEEVIIPANTKGVVIGSPKDNRVAVSFEAGSDRFLMFGPNPKRRNDFVLLAKDWENDYGTVTYDGQEWQVPSRSAYATLLIDMDKYSKTTYSTRKAKGRSVND